MVSMKIHATVAVICFLVASLTCNASTPGDEPAKYTTPTAPSPPPPPSSPPPPAAYPPSPPVRPVIVVEGVIYCKSCKLRGYSRDMDASPLPNATASLVCYGGAASKYRVLNLTSTATDKNGYFVVMVYDVGMFDLRSCKVYLRSSPTRLCAAPSVPSNPKLGLSLVAEPGRAPLPKGARGAYHPNSALMYGPGAGGKCPPY